MPRTPSSLWPTMATGTAVGRSTQPAVVRVEALPVPAADAQRRAVLSLYSVKEWPAWLDTD